MRTRERSEFGTRLLMARTKAELTQPQLADAVGMSQSALAEAEGVGKSSSYTVRIAQRCGVSALWLESGEGDMLDTSAWPFGDDLRPIVLSLDTNGLAILENVLRATLSALTGAMTQVIDHTTQVQTNPSGTGNTEAPVRKNRFQSESDLRRSLASRKSGAVPKPRGDRRA